MSQNGATAVRYSYAGTGDSPDVTVDAENAVIPQTIRLPGRCSSRSRVTDEVWSYPDIHRYVISTANAPTAKLWRPARS